MNSAVLRHRLSFVPIFWDFLLLGRGRADVRGTLRMDELRRSLYVQKTRKQTLNRHTKSCNVRENKTTNKIFYNSTDAVTLAPSCVKTSSVICFSWSNTGKMRIWRLARSSSPAYNATIVKLAGELAFCTSANKKPNFVVHFWPPLSPDKTTEMRPLVR